MGVVNPLHAEGLTSDLRVYMTWKAHAWNVKMCPHLWGGWEVGRRKGGILFEFDYPPPSNHRR